MKLSKKVHYDAMIAAVRVDDPGKLADTIAAHLLGRGASKSRNLLNHLAGRAPQPHRRHPRSRRLTSSRSIAASGLRVKKQMEKAQKDTLFNEKMKAIQK